MCKYIFVGCGYDIDNKSFVLYSMEGNGYMKIIVCDNYDKLSEKAAEIVAEQVKKNPKSILGLATGSTPIGMYQKLVEKNQAGEIDFKDIRTFNLDEYYPLADDNEQSYHYFMNEHLFSKINIDPKNTHLLDGTCEDTARECAEYESLIEQSGGIDLQILGIGQNGHIGFNEPDANLDSRTHLTNLTENTIEANSRFFDDISEVPTQALTMGIGTILKARKIILLAGGKNKHNAVKALLTSSISTEMPASMLKVHSDVTLICDKEAYSNDRIGIDIGGTEIKFGVLNESLQLIHKESIPTDVSSAEKLIDDIVKKCDDLMNQYCISGIGIGTPGINRNGFITAVNLPLQNFPLQKAIAERVDVPVKVSNDANCAALGEAICGNEKAVKNLVMLSLGTGIGGGIIIDHKIYEGRGSAGEIGHFSIQMDGKPCPCGQRGCFEQYASATALIQSAEQAALENPDSLLHRLYAEHQNSLDGKLFFEAVREGCDTAAAVLDRYAEHLAVGLRGVINIFDPDMIVLSGGITNAGDVLLNRIKEKLNADVEITISRLKSDAGTIGAALLI